MRTRSRDDRRAITNDAFLTRPAINRHFPSKVVLFQQVAEQTTAMVVAGIAAAWCEQTFAVLESQRHPELLRDGKGALEHTRDFLAAVIRDAITAGELPADADAGAVSELLVAMLWGLGFHAGFVGDARQMLAVTDEFLRRVVAGGLPGTG